MLLEKIDKQDIKIFNISDITILPDYEKKIGSYAEVFFGIINETGMNVALKRYKDDYRSKILDKDTTKEIIALQFLNQYPETNSVKIYGLYFTDNGKYCYLVLEQLQTSLHNISIGVKDDETKNNGRLNAEQYKIIFYKLLKSINAIHSLGFLHNDIKLSNIMLNGNDIKLIDFGLTRFIGLSPVIYQVGRVDNTTPSVKAPDDRISFSTDMYSLALTMIHLCLRDYTYIIVNDNIISTYYNFTELSSYLSNEKKFGVNGHDLLLKLLDTDVEKRWCANKALQHPYFYSLSDNTLTEDTILHNGGISGLIKNTKYKNNIYIEKSLELCYFQEMFTNYKDVLCPIKVVTTDLDEYFALMDWILEKFNSKDSTIYSIDALINCIIMTNKNINKYYLPISKSLLGGYPRYIYTCFNIMMYHDFTVDRRINLSNTLQKRVHYFDDIEISHVFYDDYITDNINLDFYPISIYISYIYLQLEHELKIINIDSKKKFKFDKNFFLDLCLQIIIWFIQPIPFDNPITIWDVIIFSTIKLLSGIIQIPHKGLIENPIISILTIDLIKYEKMLKYYQIQYKSMEFTKYLNYNIYFNNVIFNSDILTYEKKYSNMNDID